MYPPSYRRPSCKAIDPTENQKVDPTASSEVWQAKTLPEEGQEKRQLEIPEPSGDESRHLPQGIK